jgi:hypothetical protein
MKFILQIFGTIVLAYVLEIFLPWYSIALAAFVMGFLFRSRANFLAGFLGIALLWTLKAWLLNSASASDLADRVAHIFSLRGKEWLMLVMAIVGGLVGGFAGLAGALLKPKPRSYS